MSESVKYAFTVTLKPRAFVEPGDVQYDKASYGLYKHLKALCRALTLVAELTKNCNIHYHGIITFTNASIKNVKRFHDSFRGNSIFGYVNIVQITDLNGWVDYLKKSIHDTCCVIERPPILCDEFNVLSDFHIDEPLNCGEGKAYFQYYDQD